MGDQSRIERDRNRQPGLEPEGLFVGRLSAWSLGLLAPDWRVDSDLFQ